MTAIRVRRLTVRYDGPAVLDAVDLDVAPGEWVGLIGPNGAGKSTLLRAIVGQVTVDGEVEVLGDPVDRLDQRALARRVALVPQNPVVPPGMTVGDYVLLGRTPHLGAFAVEGPGDRAIVTDQLARLDLEGFAARLLDTLSGGELQRVVLARALAQQAPVLLLDEPTSALDVGHQQQVLELVDQLRREDGLAVVAAMHDLNLAGQYTDRLTLLAKGRVAAQGAPRDVLTVEHLERHYDARVRVLHDECDGVVVVPLRRLPDHGAASDALAAPATSRTAT